MSLLTALDDYTANYTGKPDFNYIQINQIDFPGGVERAAFDRYLELRGRLYGNDPRPVTLNDILHAANLYLLRSSDGNVCRVSQYDSAVIERGGRLQVVLSKYNGTPICPGDSIYMFESPDADSLMPVLKDRSVILTCPVQTNVCGALLRICSPAVCDFSGLPEYCGVTPEEFVFGAADRFITFAVVSGKSQVSFPEEFHKVGVIAQSGNVEITCGEERISVPLIDMNTQTEGICAELRATPFDPYAAPHAAAVLSDVTNSRKLIAVPNTRFGGSCPYFDGYLSVATLMARLACEGIPRRDCSCTLNGARIGQERIADSISFILGVFSAILDFGVTVRNASDFKWDKGAAYCCAYCPDGQFSDGTLSGGKYLYRLTPLYTPYGLPDKSDYEKMLCYLGHLFRSGIAVSASVDPPYNNEAYKFGADVTEEETLSALPCSVYVTASSPIEGRLLALSQST